MRSNVSGSTHALSRRHDVSQKHKALPSTTKKTATMPSVTSDRPDRGERRTDLEDEDEHDDTLFEGVVEPNEEAYIDLFLNDGNQGGSHVEGGGGNYRRVDPKVVSITSNQLLYKGNVFWRIEPGQGFDCECALRNGTYLEVTVECQQELGDKGDNEETMHTKTPKASSFDAWLRRGLSASNSSMKSHNDEKEPATLSGFRQIRRFDCESLIRASAIAYQMYAVEEEVGFQFQLLNELHFDRPVISIDSPSSNGEEHNAIEVRNEEFGDIGNHDRSKDEEDRVEADVTPNDSGSLAGSSFSSCSDEDDEVDDDDDADPNRLSPESSVYLNLNYEMKGGGGFRDASRNAKTQKAANGGPDVLASTEPMSMIDLPDFEKVKRGVNQVLKLLGVKSSE